MKYNCSGAMLDPHCACIYISQCSVLKRSLKGDGNWIELT